MSDSSSVGVVKRVKIKVRGTPIGLVYGEVYWHLKPCDLAASSLYIVKSPYGRFKVVSPCASRVP